NTSVAVNITQVNPANSFLIFNRAAGNLIEGIESRYQVRGYFTDFVGNQLTFDRTTSGTDTADISYFVITIPTASVQYGLSTIAAAVGSGASTISGVDTSASAVFMSLRGGGGDASFLDETSVTAQLASATSASFHRLSTAGTGVDISYY